MNDDGSCLPTRVLLVEDHEPFRRLVRAKLQEHEGLLLAGETGNGLDAVSRCLELHPDLVLMDVGLPGLSGIEATRRILAFAPACKIIFLTQENAPEIVREALRLGAAGYVIKTHAASDLLPAIIAAKEGRRFVSEAVAFRDDDLGPEAYTIADNPSREPASTTQSETAHSHVVHFHPDDQSLLAGFTGFVEDALKAGKAVIIITTKSHRQEILQALQERGLNMVAAIEAGRFVSLDAEETLASFMVDDLPDHDLFFSAAGEIVKSVKAMNPGCPVLACGECAPTLWAQGNGKAAIQLEYLWDQLVRMYDLETLCGYMLTSAQRTRERSTYDGICAAHSSFCSF
jgi:DNA-binding NarL/FixJ family response regulator